MKYYDVWKYLELLKRKYPEIDLDKAEMKIKSIRNSKVRIGNVTAEVDVKNAPGKLDISAKINVKEQTSSFGDSEIVSKTLTFKGIKVKGKVNDKIRSWFGKRIYAGATDILLNDVSIITGAYGTQLKGM